METLYSFVLPNGTITPHMSLEEATNKEYLKYITREECIQEIKDFNFTIFEQAKAENIKEELAKLLYIMTPKQAGKVIDVGQNKIYELLHSGQLKAKKLKRTWLINRYDLMEFILNTDLH